MELSIRDRILLLGSLEPKGDYHTLKEILEFRKELDFSEEEVRKFDIEQTESSNGQTQISFNYEASVGYDIDYQIKPRVISAIASGLKLLNDEKNLTEQFITLYEKFVLGT